MSSTYFHFKKADVFFLTRCNFLLNNFTSRELFFTSFCKQKLCFCVKPISSKTVLNYSIIIVPLIFGEQRFFLRIFRQFTNFLFFFSDFECDYFFNNNPIQTGIENVLLVNPAFGNIWEFTLYLLSTL